MYVIVIYTFYLVITAYAVAPPVGSADSLWANMLSNSNPITLNGN